MLQQQVQEWQRTQQQQQQQQEVELYKGHHKINVRLTKEQEVELFRLFVGKCEPRDEEGAAMTTTRPPVLLFRYNQVVIGRITEQMFGQFVWTNGRSYSSSSSSSNMMAWQPRLRNSNGGIDQALQIAVLMKDQHKKEEFYFSYGLFELMWSWALVPSPLGPRAFHDCTIRDLTRASVYSSYVEAPTSVIMYHPAWCNVTWYLLKRMPLSNVRSLIYRIGTNSFNLPPYCSNNSGQSLMMRCPLCQDKPVVTLDHIVFTCRVSEELWSSFDLAFNTVMIKPCFEAIFGAVDRSGFADWWQQRHHLHEKEMANSDGGDGQNDRTIRTSRYQTALEAYHGSNGARLTDKRLTIALLELLHIWLTWTNWWVCYKNRNTHTNNNNSGNGGGGRGRGRYISVAARWRNLVYNCYVLLPENTKRIWQQNKLLAPYLGNK